MRIGTWCLLLGLATTAEAQRVPITEANVAAFLRAMTPAAAEARRLLALQRDVSRDIAVQRLDSLRACRDPKREQALLQPGTAMGMPLDEYERLSVAASRGDRAALAKIKEIGDRMQAASRAVTSRATECERTVPPQPWFVRRRVASRAELDRLGWTNDSYQTMTTTGRAQYFGARLDSIALAHVDGTLSPAELRALFAALREAVNDAGAASAAERLVVARHRDELRAVIEDLY